MLEMSKFLETVKLHGSVLEEGYRNYPDGTRELLRVYRDPLERAIDRHARRKGEKTTPPKIMRQGEEIVLPQVTGNLPDILSDPSQRTAALRDAAVMIALQYSRIPHVEPEMMTALVKRQKELEENFQNPKENPNVTKFRAGRFLMDASDIFVNDKPDPERIAEIRKELERWENS